MAFREGVIGYMKTDYDFGFGVIPAGSEVEVYWEDSQITGRVIYGWKDAEVTVDWVSIEDNVSFEEEYDGEDE